MHLYPSTRYLALVKFLSAQFSIIRFVFQNEILRRNALEAAEKTNCQQQTTQNTEQSSLQAAITNICVIIGFAAFAYTVKYVIRSLGTD